jgi:ribosomal protein L34E
VEVECGHIFCEACALKLLKCKTCGKRLSGILNSATDKLETMSKNYDELLAKL